MTTSVVVVPVRALSRAPTPDRRAPPKSRAGTSAESRRAACNAVALVLSR